MKKTMTAAAAALTLCATGAAHAATYNTDVNTFDGSSGNFGDSGITGSFNDQYTFDNMMPGSYDLTLSTASSGISFNEITFDNQRLSFVAQIQGTKFYGLSDVTVNAGTQVLDVVGGFNGGAGASGSYDGTVAFTVSAAPEPSVWALMIAGVAMIGGMLRLGRRRGSMASAVA